MFPPVLAARHLSLGDGDEGNRGSTAETVAAAAWLMSWKVLKPNSDVLMRVTLTREWDNG